MYSAAVHLTRVVRATGGHTNNYVTTELNDKLFNSHIASCLTCHGRMSFRRTQTAQTSETHDDTEGIRTRAGSAQLISSPCSQPPGHSVMCMKYDVCLQHPFTCLHVLYAALICYTNMKHSLQQQRPLTGAGMAGKDSGVCSGGHQSKHHLTLPAVME